jgi:uncharacterized membrane protein
MATNNITPTDIESQSDAPIQQSNQLPNVQLQAYGLFSGPLPHPNIMERYESILPGAAERLFAHLEREQAFRFKIFKFNIVISLVYSLIVCGVAVFAIYNNYPQAGIVIIGLHAGLIGSKLAIDYKIFASQKK